MLLSRRSFLSGLIASVLLSPIICRVSKAIHFEREIPIEETTLEASFELSKTAGRGLEYVVWEQPPALPYKLNLF